MAERDLQQFEARLAERLAAYAAIPVPPVDATAVASDVAGEAASRRRVAGLRVPRVAAVAWVLLALAAAAAAGLLVGALLNDRGPVPRLVLALEDGLYLADANGQDRRLVRDDGSFLLPAWEPEGTRFAVMHGPPIPGQPGASDGRPLTPDPFPLVADELLILDASGRTHASVTGPLVGFAWATPDADRPARLAARRVDGSVVVVDEDGRILFDRHVADAVPPDDAPLLRPGLAWLGPGTLLVASGPEVMRVDLGSESEPHAVVRIDAGLINDLAPSPDGRSLAFVLASCRAGCVGEARVARVESAPPAGAAAPAGRGLITDLEASTALSWAADARHVLAWPNVADNSGGSTVRAPTATVLEQRDVVPAWTRYARGGSGAILAMNAYPFFNDRHFDLWLVGPDGTATRLAQRSLGADLRAVAGP